MGQMKTNTIVGLLAQTSIHAGTGQQTGVVDLPIQREGHNGWPCVFGSAVKGALRADAEQKILAQLQKEEPLSSLETLLGKVQDRDDISIVFGPPPKAGSSGSTGIKHAGALMVTDARLLLFPVRSLTSQFKWVTCPAALQRFQADCERLGVENGQKDAFQMTLEDEGQASVALVPAATPNKSLFLEEYRFEVRQKDLGSLVENLSQLMPDAAAAKPLLEKQLVIVSDDSFAHIVSHATPVNAHISINSLTKIVRDGQLWYEETLPPETLLYIGLSAQPARKEGAEMSAVQVLDSVLGRLHENPWLQLGGNETVGMGWCAVKALVQEA